jgi:hypothetical protein
MDELMSATDVGRQDADDWPSKSGDRRVVTTAIICGRGRVGKTVVANTYVQFCRAQGARLEVWNADWQNETHTLNLFHPNAARPATDGAAEKGF